MIIMPVVVAAADAVVVEAVAVAVASLDNIYRLPFGRFRWRR